MSIGTMESVQVIGPLRVAVRWDDGRNGEIDLVPIIAAHPKLRPLADTANFLQRAEDGWSIEWPHCGIDLGSAQLRRWADEQAGEAMPAAAFRAWMEGHGLTLDRAADALGLSRRIVAYYLSGEQPVPKTVMLATEGYDKRQAA
ncbi:MAG TPA: DUF2442 domain-containing protein [Allosphingosinicella sp.]|jgi:hypothetical protein|nr:DUF2442 domain-containing protein [Allosphingosinicella sp.]